MDDVRLLLSLISLGRIGQDRRDGLVRTQALEKAGGRSLSLHHLLVEQGIFNDEQLQELVRLGTTMEPALFSPRLANPTPKGPGTDVISRLPKGFDAGTDTVSKDPHLARALATAHQSTRRKVAPPPAAAAAEALAAPEPPKRRRPLWAAAAALVGLALVSAGLVLGISAYRRAIDLAEHRDALRARLAAEREARRAQALALYQEVLDQGERGRQRAALEVGLAAYDRVLEADPDFEPARYYRGRALFRLERYREAAPDLERAAELDMQPEAARIYAALALLRGRPELAASSWAQEMDWSADEAEYRAWGLLVRIDPASPYGVIAHVLRRAAQGLLDQHDRRELDAVILKLTSCDEARYLRALCTAGLDPTQPPGPQLLAHDRPAIPPAARDEALADLGAYLAAQPFHVGARLVQQALDAPLAPVEDEAELPPELYLLATWMRIRNEPAAPVDQTGASLLRPWALARAQRDERLRVRGGLLGLVLLLEQGRLEVAAELAEQVPAAEMGTPAFALARSLLLRSLAFRRLGVWPPLEAPLGSIAALTTESASAPPSTWDLFALDLGARAQAQAYLAGLPAPPALADTGPAEDLGLFLDALETATPGALDPPPLRRWRLELHRWRARAWDQSEPPPRGRYERAVQLYAGGAAAPAAELLREAAAHTRGGRAQHALAVVLTARGQYGAALDALEQAMAAGFRPARPLLQDADFAPLRDRERFIKLAEAGASGR